MSNILALQMPVRQNIHKRESVCILRFHGATLRMRTNMFPEGFHPVVQARLPDCSSLAPFHERYKSSVQYVFTDLRYAVRNKSFEDPLGPSMDLKIVGVKILELLEEVCITLSAPNRSC